MRKPLLIVAAWALAIWAPAAAQNRQATGTAWQPASTPMEALHFRGGAWSFMLHGFVNVGYTSGSGPRGEDAVVSTSMLMAQAGRPLGPGTLVGRFMASAEPSMGAWGYPLLLQTGETADGQNPLFDRQHPHDFFMEISATYRAQVTPELAVFGYVAPAGEPAIGPVPFMHRASGRDIPNAPISHHYQDATHITFGVLTAGVVSQDRVKIEFSAFNGREPDQDRWGLETPRFDSFGVRATVNPHDDWSIQGSIASLAEPEQLHPGIDVVKLSASATYNRPLRNGNWQSTVIYGRNRSQRTIISLAEARATFPPAILDHFLSLADLGGAPEDSLLLLFPSRALTGLLLESALQVKAATVFGRFEIADKDELFEPADARHSQIYSVGRAEMGFVFDLPATALGVFGVGASGSLHFLPEELKAAYGDSPTAFHVFGRFRLGAQP